MSTILMHQDIQKYMCTHSGAFERMEEFRYLGKTIMSENSIEEMKSGLKSECCRSVQNLLSYSLLSENINNYNLESFVLQSAIRKYKQL